MTMHQYPPNQADAIILVTIPTAYAPVTIFNDAIRRPVSINENFFGCRQKSAALSRRLSRPIFSRPAGGGLGERNLHSAGAVVSMNGRTGGESWFVEVQLLVLRRP